MAEFLQAFERRTLPKEEWTHAAHVLTGACYVHRLGEAAAIDAMRRNVSRYNLAVGGQNTETSGYHETITVFWIKAIHALLRVEIRRAPLSRAAFAAAAVDRFAGDRNLHRHYYDFDVMASTEARRIWIVPTLQSLDDELPEAPGLPSTP